MEQQTTLDLRKRVSSIHQPIPINVKQKQS